MRQISPQFIPETQLKNFGLNQKLELVARDGTTKVTGTVTDISRKAEFATQRATKVGRESA